MPNNKEVHSSKPLQGDDGTRKFLAVSAVLLIVLDLITYVITRNILVLGITTPVGAVVVWPFKYYFSSRE